ncbi:CheR family methyltransferase [Sphingomonas nostoxanthinifaciens]|uniref:CheR family methyltransferase n=1 Tax=Sphingomonas nostoxanthinifaciens TaxID=2872652 RepID=UPI001CC20E75|nr:CheR family methyltransferase [Sphingomonas nostoxanthinifaciens]UAK26256.1 protein-glutamate O-methyltransferase CheR [Sphingomonas nostoxanthinifaciens]
MEMTPLAVRALSGLFEQMTGQQLADGRRWRIDVALQAVMRARDIGGLDALAAQVAHPGATELRATVVEALLNHETFFYRDMAAFRTLVDEGLPHLAERRGAARRLRIWSAGCSTGQEPYSIAFALAAAETRWRGWTIEIVGTDVSPVAIGKARAGVYSQFEVQRGLPVRDLITRFDPEGEAWRVRPAALEGVSFAVHNLLDPPPAGEFDVILCRNVLLYFSAARRRDVFDRLTTAIARDGVLMLGAGETVLGQTDAFRTDPALRGLYRPATAP